jgi:hypothetical protein
MCFLFLTVKGIRLVVAKHGYENARCVVKADARSVLFALGSGLHLFAGQHLLQLVHEQQRLHRLSPPILFFLSAVSRTSAV